MKIYAIIFLVLLLAGSASAIDSFVCLPRAVSQGSTITCTVDWASGTTEKNVAYNITFYNDTAQTINISDCSFVGTTQNSPDPVDVVQGCIIPSDWGNSTTAVANVSIPSSGASIIFLFNISSVVAKDLIISEFVFEQPCYLGEFCGIRWTVTKADTGSPVIGATCVGDVLQLIGGNLTPVITSGALGGSGERALTSRYAGHVLASFKPIATALTEGVTYVGEIRCECMPKAGSVCLDDDGQNIVNSSSPTGLIGIGTVPLPISTWLTTSTSVFLPNIGLKHRNAVSVNITNNRSDIRVPIDIIYDCRIDGDNASHRRIKSPFLFPECGTLGECNVRRGINPATTQEQSTDFIVQEHPFLQGRDTDAYCSTYVKIVDVITDFVTYSTTSTNFTITSDELNLNPNWQLISPMRLSAIINLSASEFDDYNGTGFGNIDARVHLTSDGKDITKAFDIFNELSNISVHNLTSNLTEHVDFELEFLSDGNVEFELRNVSLDKSNSNTWWNITIDFYNFELRNMRALENQTDALDEQTIELRNHSKSLAEIANKTGTFRFSVDCPPNVIRGTDADCVISAQIESGIAEKEVKFNCSLDASRMSETVFLQMINTSITLINKSFSIPMSFADNSQHTLFCTGQYDNFGRRQDPFSDTFTVIDSPLGFSPTFVADVIDRLIPDEIEEVVTKRDNFIIILILLILFIIVILRRRKRKRNRG